MNISFRSHDLFNPPADSVKPGSIIQVNIPKFGVAMSPSSEFYEVKAVKDGQIIGNEISNITKEMKAKIGRFSNTQITYDVIA